MWVQYLGWEDPLEEGTATHFSILAWRIQGQRSLGATDHSVTKSETLLKQLSTRLQSQNKSKKVLSTSGLLYPLQSLPTLRNTYTDVVMCMKLCSQKFTVFWKNTPRNSQPSKFIICWGGYAGLVETQAGIKIAKRNINNLRYADDTTLTAESEELKSLLMKVKEESEKAGLKLIIQKTKIMASGPITSWQNNGNSKKLYFLGVQNHCRWWLQPWN